MQFQGERQAGLALALGVQEVRPVDLVTAYGTLANSGKAIGHTTILTIKDANGKDVVDAVRAAGRQAGRQPAGGLHRDRHPGRQHQQEHQPVLGQVRDQRTRRAPAGDAQDRHQQRRQGPQRLRLHRAADAGRPRPAAPTRSRSASGTATRTTASSRPPAHPLFSIDVSTYVWQGFLNEATAKWPETNFERPADGLVKAQDRPIHGLAVRPTARPSTSGSSSAPSRRPRSGPTRAASMSSRRSTSRRASPTG